MRFSLYLLFSAVFLQSLSQIPIGSWRVHLPYSTGMKVEPAGEKVYCQTSGGLFVYSKTDNSSEILSKVNGLSDVVLSTIKFINEKNSLVIGYENGNIDVIRDNVIYNISDIYRKNIIGSKEINNVSYINGTVYLSCGFGIIVLDVDKFEIKDTYLIGIDGTYVDVNDICTDNTYLYAATKNGIYRALLSNPNLVNFANWTKIINTASNTSSFNNIVYFDSKVITSLKSTTNNKDTLYVLNEPDLVPFDTSVTDIRNLSVSGGKLLVSSTNYIKYYEEGTSNSDIYYYSVSGAGSAPRDCRFSPDGTLWIADYNSGLVWLRAGSWYFENSFPNGPLRKEAKAIAAGDEQIWIVPGGRTAQWSNLWNPGQIYWFKEQHWNNLDGSAIPQLWQVIDLCEIAINPKNKSQVFFASYGQGIFELNNGTFSAHYDQSNSTLESAVADGNPYYVRVGGIRVDEDENLWAVSCEVENMISVKLKNGQWHAFSIKEDVGKTIDAGRLFITGDNSKWFILPRGKGIYVFNENKTYTNTSDDKKKKLSIIDENGDIISNNVYSMAVDNDGLVWVGTDKGVVFYYNPEEVFESSLFYAQRIKIPNENPGQANYLLEAETVSAIAIDGANRKWFGTDKGGVFLMSADATTELLHFTTTNSPLLSNTIIDIAVDQKSGEVFFATDKGVVSYRGTATEGSDNFTGVYAFPNPVRPGFSGLIGIKGLVTNANVKITDITGNIVYETFAEGGQAVWDGKNFNGEKVHTGVYLVFCTNEDGSKTYVTKILFIN